MDLSVDKVKKSFSVQTFGCKVNTYDSGLLQAQLTREGFEHTEKATEAGTYILNTCAVTAEATKEAVRRVRQIKSRDPLATVVVTGCAAQVDTGAFENLKGANLVVANSHKEQLGDILKKYHASSSAEKNSPQVYKSNIFRNGALGAGGGAIAGHTRSFLKIQDGCNSFCTYCVIPFGRGKSRSLSIRSLIQRVQELHRGGSEEVVLTGVHIGDYEDSEWKVFTENGERNGRLEELVEAVLEYTTVPRLRLTSLEPVELSEKLFELYQSPRMCRHFHMSIQSACTKTLKGMKRNYTALDVEQALNDISNKVPGSFVGMDVIVGFPGETEEDFEETYQRLEHLPWTRIHVFPYSERPGTKAIHLEGKIAPAEIKRRAQKLRQLSSQRYAEQAKLQIGKVKEVLVLKKKSAMDEGDMQGLSSDYWPIRWTNESHFEEDSSKKFMIQAYQNHPSRMDGWLVGQRV